MCRILVRIARPSLDDAAVNGRRAENYVCLRLGSAGLGCLSSKNTNKYKQNKHQTDYPFFYEHHVHSLIFT
jgi:hypothetical protein